MKTNLQELNNYLFEELERLNDDEELQEDKLDKEIKRSKAITTVAQTIINNASLVLNAHKYFEEMGIENKDIPKMLTTDEQ